MRWRLPAAPTLVILLTACVTVNVYFPAAAAQQAADKIIDRVTGQGSPAGAPATDAAPGSTGAQGSAAPDGAPNAAPNVAPDAAPNAGSEPGRSAPPQAMMRSESAPRALLERVIDGLIPAAHAQGSANLDIETPQIRAITASLRQRFPRLEPFFASGAVGMTAQGLVAVRDVSAVPLAQRALVSQLVAGQNRDLMALYAEVARANGHPEWEADIQRTFAQRWVVRGVKPGWYYQDASGHWQRK